MLLRTLLALNSASLILDKIKKINPRNFPVILTGDFNLTEETVPIQILSTNLNDCYKHSVKKPYGPKGTFTNFDTNTVPTQRIDYVFVKNMTCETYRAINDRRENLLYPSDHFPVLVELRF